MPTSTYPSQMPGNILLRINNYTVLKDQQQEKRFYGSSPTRLTIPFWETIKGYIPVYTCLKVSGVVYPGLPSYKRNTEIDKSQFPINPIDSSPKRQLSTKFIRYTFQVGKILNRYVNRNNGRSVYNSGNQAAATADSSISRDEFVQRKIDEKCVVSNGETGKKWENSFAGKKLLWRRLPAGRSFFLFAKWWYCIPSIVCYYLLHKSGGSDRIL